MFWRQDKKSIWTISKNVCDKDFNIVKIMFENYICYICH
jgi:hypothetical protein